MALAVAWLALVVVVFAIARGSRRLARRLGDLTRGEEGRSLDAVLDAHLDKLFAVARDVDDVVVRMAQVETASKASFQRVGLVRFNPFEDTGGNQSFALALLDDNGSGLILSSLHARAGTRLYAKGVERGRSDAALSDEESRALAQAMRDSGRGSPATV
ncbi:MAG: DUF4446 family protein [Chloroflexota bacterium]